MSGEDVKYFNFPCGTFDRRNIFLVSIWINFNSLITVDSIAIEVQCFIVSSIWNIAKLFLLDKSCDVLGTGYTRAELFV